MNIQLAAGPGLMPGSSDAPFLIFPLIAAVLILLMVSAQTWDNLLAVAVTAIVVVVVLVIATVTFIFTSTGAATDAHDKWVASTQKWASDRYGVEAGLDNFEERSGLNKYSDSVCPTITNCYISDALIDGAIVSVKLVYVGEHAMLVAGGSTEMKELDVVSK